eukprot:g10060.t1
MTLQMCSSSSSSSGVISLMLCRSKVDKAFRYGHGLVFMPFLLSTWNFVSGELAKNFISFIGLDLANLHHLPL